jgi:hypothetical protein
MKNRPTKATPNRSTSDVSHAPKPVIGHSAGVMATTTITTSATSCRADTIGTGFIPSGV